MNPELNDLVNVAETCVTLDIYLHESMLFLKTYKRIFGVGPVGLVITLLFWAVFYFLERALGVPSMKINDTVRFLLLIVLGVDAAYLFIGGTITLIRNYWGKRLITSGPYQFIRHPLYGALIYSGTGCLALWFYSWGLLISVIPITIFWSWIVTKEEQYVLDRFGEDYNKYIKQTGQFFPLYTSFKKDSDSPKEL